MTNPKQKKQLLIMLVILVVVAAAFFAVTAFNHYRDQQETSQSATLLNLDNIDEISYDNGADQLSFALDENDIWYYTENPDFPLQSSYVETIDETLTGLQAVREIPAEESDTLAAYGLETPQATVTAVGTDDQEITLLIGNSNSNGYYLKFADSDTIYTIDAQLMDAISLSLYDMGEIEDIPAFDLGKLSLVEINDTVITVNTETTTDEEGEETSTTTWLHDGADVSDYSQISAISYNIPYLDFNSGLAAWRPTDDELSQFGLLHPIRVTFHYQEEEADTESIYTLLIGNQNEDGAYYAMVPDGDRVYTISETDVAGLVSVAESGLNANISLDE